MPLDETQAPCLLADGRHVLFAALKEGVSDIWSLDLETDDGHEPHPGRVRRQQPAGLPGRQAGRLRAPHQRQRQDLRLPAGRPVAQDAAHLRPLRRHRAHLLHATGSWSTTPPTRTTTSPTCGASTCRPGRSSSTPTSSGERWRRRRSRRRGATGSPSSPTSRASTSCTPATPRSRSRRSTRRSSAAAEGLVDFQPDVTHQVVPGEQAPEAAVRGALPRGPSPDQRRGDLERRLLRGDRGRADRRARGPELFTLTVLSVALLPHLRRALHQPGQPPALRGQLLRPDLLLLPATTPSTRSTTATTPATSRSPPSASPAASSSSSTPSTRSGGSRPGWGSSRSPSGSRTRASSSRSASRARSLGPALLHQQRLAGAGLAAPRPGDDPLRRVRAPLRQHLQRRA